MNRQAREHGAGRTEHSPDEPCPPGASRIGEVLDGKYRIVRELGRGGMGAVYEAEHAVIGRRFAVKFPHVELAQRGELLERFRREARVAGSLESEHLAAAVDFGAAADGSPYLVMEYLRGENLGELLARTGPLATARAASIVQQACRGLAVAHAHGVIHRDLKPENLFVCRRSDGTDLVKVLDFGVAKLGGAEQGVTLTRTGATMGTPFYMAPEQARGEKQLDERADVYALGVILYEALSGQVPHPGESYNAVIYHILTKQPQPLAELRPGLPPELLEVIARALAHEPQERFGNAAELGEALASFARAPAPPEARQRDRAGSATTVAEQLTGEQPADGGGTDGDGAARRPSETDIALVAAGLRRSGRVSAGRRRLFGGAAALVLALVALVVWQAREPPQDAVGQPSGLASAGEPPATATQAPAVATGVPPPTALPADPAGAPEAPSAGRPDARPDVHSDTTGKPRRGDAPPRATTQPAATAAPAATPEGASRGPTGFDRDNPY